LVRIEVSVRLLAIEDEPKLGQLIVSSLTQAGFAVDWSQTLSEGKEFVTANSYDLILLDLRLPDGNGLDFLRALRRSRNNIPVIILSAADTVDDRVMGLTEGADDYIVKPFASSELVARIRVALRRPGAAFGIDLVCGNVEFNTVNSTVSIGGTPIQVPRRELAILESLMRANGRVVTKAALEEAAYAMDDDRQSNVIESHLSRLRRRLESAGAQIRVRVARGIGYRIEEAREQNAASGEISSVS
jgi:DNA-binding response OmpR family regulator